jgi:hypothetical protein
MRYLGLLLIMTCVGSSGCSALIVESGVDLHDLRTREQVHEQFGEPAASRTAEGRVVEEFCTCQKIAEPMRGAHLGMTVVMTYGLGEFVAFPIELYNLGRHTLLGQHVCFTYDATGNVMHLYAPEQRFDDDVSGPEESAGGTASVDGRR